MVVPHTGCGKGRTMASNNRWIFGTIAVIWLVVIITSLRSPELVFGSEPVVIRVCTIANWFWGLVATLLVLRSTVFRRPTEMGWGQTDAWGWVAFSVSLLWFMVMVVTFVVPDVVIGETLVVPVAAIVAPVVAVALTHSLAEFLISGFAARRAGAELTEPH